MNNPLGASPRLVTIFSGHAHDDEFSLLTINSLEQQVSVLTGNPMLIPGIVEHRRSAQDGLDLLGDRQYELSLLSSERERYREPSGYLTNGHQHMLARCVRDRQSQTTSS